jgi:hypothetical protein
MRGFQTSCEIKGNEMSCLIRKNKAGNLVVPEKIGEQKTLKFNSGKQPRNREQQNKGTEIFQIKQ